MHGASRRLAFGVSGGSGYHREPDLPQSACAASTKALPSGYNVQMHQKPLWWAQWKTTQNSFLTPNNPKRLGIMTPVTQPTEPLPVDKVTIENYFCIRRKPLSPRLRQIAILQALQRRWRHKSRKARTQRIRRAPHGEYATHSAIFVRSTGRTARRLRRMIALHTPSIFANSIVPNCGNFAKKFVTI